MTNRLCSGCVWGSDASALKWWMEDACAQPSRPVSNIPPLCRGPIHALVAHVDATDDSRLIVLCSTSGAVWNIHIGLWGECSVELGSRILSIPGERIQAVYAPVPGMLKFAVTAMNRLYDTDGALVVSAVRLGVSFAQALLRGDMYNPQVPVLCASGTYNGDVVCWCPSPPELAADHNQGHVLWRLQAHRPGCVIMSLSVHNYTGDRDNCAFLVATGSDDRSATLSRVAQCRGGSSPARTELIWRRGEDSTFAKSRVRCVHSCVIPPHPEDVNAALTPPDVLVCVGGEDGSVQAVRVTPGVEGAAGSGDVVLRSLDQYPPHGCSAIAALPTRFSSPLRMLSAGFDGGVYLHSFQRSLSPCGANVVESALPDCMGKVRCLVAVPMAALNAASFAVALTDAHFIALLFHDGRTLNARVCGQRSLMETKPCCVVVMHATVSTVVLIAGYLDGSVILLRVSVFDLRAEVVCSPVFKLKSKVVHLVCDDSGPTGGRLQGHGVCFSDATTEGALYLHTGGLLEEAPIAEESLWRVRGSFGADCTAVGASATPLQLVVVGCSKKRTVRCSIATGGNTVGEHECPLPFPDRRALIDAVHIRWMNEPPGDEVLVALYSADGVVRASVHATPVGGNVCWTWIDSFAPSTFPWRFSKVLFGTDGLMTTQQGSTVRVHITHAQGLVRGTWLAASTIEGVTAPRLIDARTVRTTHGARSAVVFSPDGTRVLLHTTSFYSSDAPQPVHEPLLAVRLLQEPIVGSPDLNCCASWTGSDEQSETIATGGESTYIKLYASDSIGGWAVSTLCGGHTSNILGVVFLPAKDSFGPHLVSVGSLATICLWEYNSAMNPPWLLRDRMGFDGSSTVDAVEAVPRFLCCALIEHPGGNASHSIAVGTSTGSIELFDIHVGTCLLTRRSHPSLVPCVSCSPRPILCLCAPPPQWAPIVGVAGDSHGRAALFLEESGRWSANVAQMDSAAVTAVVCMSEGRRLVACGMDSGAVVLAAVHENCLVRIVVVSVATTPVRSLFLHNGLLLAVADGVASVLSMIRGTELTVERCYYVPVVRNVSQATLDIAGGLVVVGQGQTRMQL